jgi:hypothetical protein
MSINFLRVRPIGLSQKQPSLFLSDAKNRLTIQRSPVLAPLLCKAELVWTTALNEQLGQPSCYSGPKIKWLSLPKSPFSLKSLHLQRHDR